MPSLKSATGQPNVDVEEVDDFVIVHRPVERMHLEGFRWSRTRSC